MLNLIISWSIRRRRLVIAAGLIMGLLGAFAGSRLPIDAFPDTTPIQVQINTAAPALVPLTVPYRAAPPSERPGTDVARPTPAAASSGLTPPSKASPREENGATASASGNISIFMRSPSDWSGEVVE